MKKGDAVVALKTYMPDKMEVFARGKYMGVDPENGEEMIAFETTLRGESTTIIMKASAFDHIVSENIYNIMSYKARLNNAMITYDHLGKDLELELEKKNS